MPEKSVFISSCSRRALARRRAARAVLRAELLLPAMMLLCGLAAFLAGRGGL